MSKKIFIIDILKNSSQFQLSLNEEKIKRNLLEYSPEQFENIVSHIEVNRLIDEEVINSVINSFFPKELTSLLNVSNLDVEEAEEITSIIDRLFFTDLENNELLNTDFLLKFVGLIIDEIIKNVIKEYYYKHLNDGNLLTDSTDSQELLEFYFMNRYNFLDYYFSTSLPLLAVFISMQKEIFTKNILANDNLKTSFLKQFSEFYNVLIHTFSNMEKEITIFRESIKLDSRIFPNKRNIKKYNCYESLDNLKNTLDELIENLSFTISKLNEHKKEIKNKIYENKYNTMDNINFSLELVNNSLDFILKFLKGGGK